MTRNFPFLFFVLFLSSAAGVSAEPFQLRGHIQSEGTLTDYGRGDVGDLLGPEQPVSGAIDIRMNAQYTDGPLTFVTHSELLGIWSDGPLGSSGSFPTVFQREVFQSDNRRLFDLSKQVLNDADGTMTLRLDRAYLDYKNEELVIRFGRQAVTWGNGLVFQTIDLFNPFSPTEINKDYKVGDDLLYAQWLFDSGDDLQFLFVPRRDLDTGNLAEDQNSYALKYRGALARGIEYDLLLSRHYGEALVGAGVSKDILGALWRMDLIALEADGENGGISLVTNVDRSWELFGYNMYGFIEYFFNGAGTDQENYLMPPQRLAERIERGELFTLARHYLSHGFRVELTPLLNFYPSHILNLDDKSGIVQIQAVYDLYTDLQLVFGTNLPYGGHDTEFGGIGLPDGSSLFAGESFYGRCTLFF